MFYRSTRNPKYTYLENLIITLWFITQIAPEKSQSTKGPSFVWLLGVITDDFSQSRISSGAKGVMDANCASGCHLSAFRLSNPLKPNGEHIE
jgi:hypothetical protein